MKPRKSTDNAEQADGQTGAGYKRLHIALEGAGLGFWDWNVASGEVFFSNDCAAILGYQPHELEPNKKSWNRLLHPSDLAALNEAVESHLAGHTPFCNFEHRMRHRDGKWVWVLTQGRVYERDADGSALRAAGIHKDITTRKEAQQELLLSREMYKNTVELTTQIPWIANTDGAIISCDPVWESYTGLPLENAMSNKWLESVHPDDRQPMIERWMKSIKSGEPYRFANRLWRKTGEYRYCESRAQAQRNGAGDIIRWYGTTEDIHERITAERALRESEARYSLALDAARLATWDCNVRTGVVIRDARWFEITGYDSHETAPTVEFWSSLIHPDDLPRVLTNWNAQDKAAPETYRTEFRVRHKSGDWRWICSHGRVVERDENGPIRLCGINQDITDQKRIEAALSKSELFSRVLLDSYQDWVTLIDERGRIVYMNLAGIKRLGVARPSWEGVPWLDFWKGEDHNRILQALNAARAGDSDSFQALSTGTLASPEWWDVLVSPMHGNGFEEKRILTVAREITRLKEEEERQRAIEERKAADELRTANQMLQELSGQLLRLQDDEQKRIARELHDGTVQVLSGAIMNLSVLEESPALAKLTWERELLKKSLDLTQQCVKELRTLSYLLHPPALDELGLVPALRSWVDGFGERSGIEVDLTLPDGGPRLAPSLERTLFRIAQEALGNVHRHSGSATAAVRLLLSSKQVELVIEDQGKGFSMESGSTRFGVGLLGMRERARQVGGTFEVYSQPGNTRVRVMLPRSGEDA